MQRKMRVALVLSVSMLLIASVASAEEPWGVNLMRGDSLAGWDHGAQPPTGWTISAGRLAGNANSSPLLSGFTAGDFELRFAWSVSAGGAWKISLPEAPAGNGLELIFREGDGCGRLTDDGRELAPGGKIEAIPDAMHTAIMLRTGEKFSLSVDGQLLYEAPIEAERRFGLALAVAAGEGTLAELRGTEPPGEPMFNGTDYAGWWTPGNIAKWQVDGDEMVRLDRAGDYLRSEKEYGNFTLSLWYKMRQGGNSGLGIRTPRLGWPSSDGMELQWFDRGPGLDKQANMAIYGNVLPLARADRSEQWNHLVVKADGRMISAWVNGELVQQANTFDHPELRHRPPKGWIGFQDHGAWIRLRDVRILEAPDGPALAAWYLPRPKQATVAMVERLMNPESLSAADGIQSGCVLNTISEEDPTEHVLAELTGPGAVVRIARTSDEGRLAFYFDGEDQPRIECAAGQLRGRVPPLCEDANPVLTCVTYQKSLKIVLREARQAEYRVDYVTFPADYQLASFQDPKSGFPRGWLAPVIYRYQKHGWGARRNHDPLPRFGGHKETIAPGTTVPLVHVDGAGVVEFVKLLAGKSVLQNNDLWLEVTIDGEDRPAVATPVRFYFPGLAGGGNWYNFATLDQGGAINTLAMPYGNGITVSLRNCGRQPIPDVGVSMAVTQATDLNRDEITARMRLRGVFQTAEDSNDRLIYQEGTGRWVALICQPTGIQSLRVDDVPRDGWTAANLDSFLGRPGDFRTGLSGRQGGLCWRYLWMAPVEFQKSLLLTAGGDRIGDRLALFYLKP